MHRRKLQELNLLDDFLFNKVVSHPEFGEKFSRELLRIILGKQVGKLKVVPQKVYYGSDTEYHGARLDVYLEEALDGEGFLEDATIYDIEPEQSDKREKLSNIPKRVRFYHSKIDAGALKSGEDYRCLKNVIVIMIMSTDPFGYNHMIYTIENYCKELPEMLYDDGAKTLFLYTKGTEGNPAKELKDFLCYMEKSCEENAQSDTLKEIHRMVNAVKRDEEVSIEYMKIFEREQMIREEARQEEKANTERERLRADAEKKRADTAEMEIKRLIQKIEQLKSQELL